MANLLGIVNQQQAPIASIDEKLRILCTRQNIWDYSGLEQEDFSALPESRQLQLLRKFYFDILPSLSNAKSNSNIDFSIGTTIRNSKGLKMKKVIENGDERSEMTVSVSDQDRMKKSLNLWEKLGYFGTETCDFSIEKANLPENSAFYINQAYQS